MVRWGHTTLLTEGREYDRGKLTKSKAIVIEWVMHSWVILL